MTLLLKSAFTPNCSIAKHVERSILLGYVFMAAAFWLASPSKILPRPGDVLSAFPRLWNEEGLGVELWTSLALNAQAIAIMTLLSLLVSYATALAGLRPIALGIAAFRFNGFVGLPLLLTILIGDQHWIKVALLVIGMSVFTVPSLVAMIEAIPSDSYDHARVLKMGDWRVLWEVVILGRFHEVIDILRTNLAVGWMLLPMVEGLFRSEGGIGVMILTENKYFKLDSVYAIIIFVASIGILQDLAVVGVKRIICPYAFKATERK